MMYLLDSSFIISLLRNKEKAVDFITSRKKEEIITSSICLTEVMTGVYRSRNIPKRKKEAEELFDSFYTVVEFDKEQADLAAKIKAELSKKGNLIDDLDILIVAAALSSNATLVTYNPRHFQRIKELKVVSLL